MLHALDTHRLLYRNAKLRAFLLDGDQNTTPAKFYDITGPLDAEHPIENYDCGYFVSTNEEGYICRESDQAIVRQLAVTHNVVIQVSLDGGQSWPIQWNVAGQDAAQFLQSTDIKSLWFYDDDGNLKEYNPAVQEETLPDYIRRGEIDLNNIWIEETLIVEPTDTAITLSKWTKSIIIPDDTIDNTRVIAIHNGAARAGQVIHVLSLSQKQITLALDNGLNYKFANNLATQNPPVSCTGLCVLIVNPDNSITVQGVLDATNLREVKAGDLLVPGYTYYYRGATNVGFVVNGISANFVFINSSAYNVKINNDYVPAGAAAMFVSGLRTNINSVFIVMDSFLQHAYDNAGNWSYYVQTVLTANTINVINIDISSWTDKPGCSGSDEVFNIELPDVLGANDDYDLIVNIQGTSHDSLPHPFTINLARNGNVLAELKTGCFVFEGDGLVKCRVKTTKDLHFMVWDASHGV